MVNVQGDTRMFTRLLDHPFSLALTGGLGVLDLAQRRFQDVLTWRTLYGVAVPRPGTHLVVRRLTPATL